MPGGKAFGFIRQEGSMSSEEMPSDCCQTGAAAGREGRKGAKIAASPQEDHETTTGGSREGTSRVVGLLPARRWLCYGPSVSRRAAGESTGSAVSSPAMMPWTLGGCQQGGRQQQSGQGTLVLRLERGHSCPQRAGRDTRRTRTSAPRQESRPLRGLLFLPHSYACHSHSPLRRQASLVPRSATPASL